MRCPRRRRCNSPARPLLLLCSTAPAPGWRACAPARPSGCRPCRPTPPTHPPHPPTCASCTTSCSSCMDTTRACVHSTPAMHPNSSSAPAMRRRWRHMVEPARGWGRQAPAGDGRPVGGRAAGGQLPSRRLALPSRWQPHLPPRLPTTHTPHQYTSTTTCCAPPPPPPLLLTARHVHRVPHHAPLPAGGVQEDGGGQDEGHEGGGGGAGQAKHKLGVGREGEGGGGEAGRRGTEGRVRRWGQQGSWQGARERGRLWDSAQSAARLCLPTAGWPAHPWVCTHPPARPPTSTFGSSTAMAYEAPSMAAVSRFACSWLSCGGPAPAPPASAGPFLAGAGAGARAGVQRASQGAKVACSGMTVSGMVPSSETPNPYLSTRSACSRTPLAPCPPKLRSTSPAVLRPVDVGDGGGGWGRGRGPGRLCGGHVHAGVHGMRPAHAPAAASSRRGRTCQPPSPDPHHPRAALPPHREPPHTHTWPQRRSSRRRRRPHRWLPTAACLAAPPPSSCAWRGAGRRGRC